jgi:hypothetical protein
LNVVAIRRSKINENLDQNRPCPRACGQSCPRQFDAGIGRLLWRRARAWRRLRSRLGNRHHWDGDRWERASAVLLWRLRRPSLPSRPAGMQNIRAALLQQRVWRVRLPAACPQLLPKPNLLLGSGLIKLFFIQGSSYAECDYNGGRKRGHDANNNGRGFRSPDCQPSSERRGGR